MEGFTIIDGIAAILIVLSALLAYSRGFVREVLSIGGWIAAIIVGYLFANQIRPLIVMVPMAGDFIGEQCELALLISFAVVMVAALIVMSVFTPLFSNMVQRSILGGFDQGFGFLFGVARGVLLIVVALMAYELAGAGESVPVIDDSRTAKLSGSLRDAVSGQLPEDVPGWLQVRFDEFVAVCGQG